MNEIRQHLLDLENSDPSGIDRYVEFISEKKTSKNSFTECHHILPKKIFPQFAKCDWNKIHLLGRDHFLAHYYLVRAVDNYSFLLAFNIMKSRLDKTIPDYENLAVLYEEYRQKVKEALRIKNTGKKQSPEAIEKTRIKNTGKKRSAEFCERNRIKSPETLSKLVEAGKRNKGVVRDQKFKDAVSANRSKKACARYSSTKEYIGLVDVTDTRWGTGEIEGVNKGVKHPSVSESKRGTFPCKFSANGAPAGNFSRDDPKFIDGTVVGVRKVLKFE